MEVETIHQYCFKRGSETCSVEFFLSTKAMGHQINEPGKIWLFISVKGNEEHKFCLPKSIDILRQPKEIVRVIVKRETLHYLQRLSTSQSVFSDLQTGGE